MKVIWKNEIIDVENVKVDFHDRGYQFGDGLYEVIRVHNGILFTLEEHNQRLFDGARKIEMTLPFTVEELEELLKGLVEVNGLREGYIYLQVSRGDGIARNHFFPDVSVSKPVLSGFTVEMARQVEKINSGVDVVIIPDLRWLKCDVKSISLLGNVLAKNEAAKAGVAEVIQHRDGIVTEGSSSNIMMVKDGIIYTHQNDNLILPGITKIVIVDCANKAGIKLVEGDFTVDFLQSADEVFLSSTLCEVMAIVRIDGMLVGDGTPGPITRKLAKLYEDVIIEKCGVLV
ncbi:MAG: D-amino-acid transaminase [Culicoidibacterales bacterium]